MLNVFKGWMARTLVSRDSKVILKVYKTLIRPQLEYASTVWSPHRVGMISKVERVQRKVSKLMVFNKPYSERLRALQLPSLRWRRNYIDMLRVHQILHGDEQMRKQLFTLSLEVSSSQSLRRHNLNLYKTIVHTDIYKFHFVSRVIDHWNSLPHDLLDITSFILFKKRLKLYLLNKGPLSPFEWNLN